jgi:hypothetical protein
MLKRTLLMIAALGVMGWLSNSAAQAGQTSVVADPALRCDSLQRSDFSGVQDAPTQVTVSKLVKAGGGVPAYCQIKGYIVPQIGFELRLPENWNGKFMEVGCGGWCGSINADACAPPLKRGYACVASNMGHEGAGEDTLWADRNLQAQIDFGYRATHVALLSGKAIAERFYGREPARSYFVGCSTGGYQGVTEAERFPWDFDGIIAGAPDIDESGADLRSIWITRTSLDGSGKPLLTRDTLQLVHDAALKRCDLDDGVMDRVIGNPLACETDPKDLLCSKGRTTGCLTSTQAQVVSKLYAGPMTSDGESISTGGFPPGSELLWAQIEPAWGLEQYFKYGIPGYSTSGQWKYTDFNFDQDYKRFGLAAHFDNSNPDLRKFKHAGGKLIIYQGGSDTIDLPGPVVDYYETVERTMGGHAVTQDFFRLFLIPGMYHCTGGDGAYAIDYLSALEAWVERGKAPDKLIGAHVSDGYLAAHPNTAGESAQTPEEKLWMSALELELPLDPAIPVAFTRPVYPFPTRAKYKGTGDPNEAASFVPVDGK